MKKCNHKTNRIHETTFSGSYAVVENPGQDNQIIIHQCDALADGIRYIKNQNEDAELDIMKIQQDGSLTTEL